MSETCSALAEILSAAVDGEADAAERLALDGHLAECDRCRQRFARLERLRRRTLVSAAPELNELIDRIDPGLVAAPPERVGRHRTHAAPRPRARRRHRRHHLVPYAAAVLLVALASVGAVGWLGRASRPSRPARPVATAASAGSVVTVRLADQQAMTRQVTVRRGAEVRWLNTDLGLHHLVIDSDGARIDSYLDRRGSETVTYTHPGTYRFECELHPELSGTVTVL